jgi:hypothetical protein
MAFYGMGQGGHMLRAAACRARRYGYYLPLTLDGAGGATKVSVAVRIDDAVARLKWT